MQGVNSDERAARAFAALLPTRQHISSEDVRRRALRIRPIRAITKLKLSEYWAVHPAAERALRTWLEDAGRAQWRQPHDIKCWHANASFLAGNRVVFNIHGNAYRLVAAVVYRFGAVYIKFIGTQAQYDAIDAATVEPKP